MPTESPATIAKDIRKFAIIQIVITIAFLLFVFWAFGGTQDARPPIWVFVVLFATIAIAAFFSERVWLGAQPLDPERNADVNERLALDAFTSQTMRRLLISEAPLLFAVLMCFVGTWGGWPVLISAIPGLALQMFETYPSLRNTSMAAAIMDGNGAESRLVENFRSA